MQRTFLLQAGRREDSSPWFISGGFGCHGTGLQHVLARGTGEFAPFGAAAPDGQAGSWPGT